MSDIDDTLVSKLVMAEQDGLRDATGQDAGQVPTYTPVAFTATGQID
jgi:hypothetical protein